MTVKKMKEWLMKQHHSFAVLEMEDEARHLHAQVWFDTPRVRGDVCKQIQRLCEQTVEDFDAAQKKVLRQGVRIAYSDWYLDYLADNQLKKDAPNIIVNSPPEQSLSYYPSEEEQEQVKAVANSVDAQLTRYEQQCNEYLENEELELTLTNVARWFSYASAVVRTIPVPRKKIDRTNMVSSLYFYMKKEVNPEFWYTPHEVKIDKKTQILLDAFPPAN